MRRARAIVSGARPAPTLYDAVHELLAAHQRTDPHLEDGCSVCRIARAALAGIRGERP